MPKQQAPQCPLHLSGRPGPVAISQSPRHNVARRTRGLKPLSPPGGTCVPQATLTLVSDNAQHQPCGCVKSTPGDKNNIVFYTPTYLNIREK